MESKPVLPISCECDTGSSLRRYSAHEGELAAREEIDQLDQRLRELQVRAVELRTKGAAVGGDPQARWLAGISGADDGTVQKLLMVLLALVVEIASGFGVYLVTGMNLRATCHQQAPRSWHLTLQVIK